MENIILTVFGMTYLPVILFKIAIALVIYVVAALVSGMAEKILTGIFKFILKGRSEKTVQAFTQSFAKPTAAFIKIVGIYCAVNTLPLGATVKIAVMGIMTVVLRIALILMVSVSLQNFVMNMPDMFDGFVEKFGGNQTIVSFFTKLVKALIMVFTLVIIIEEFGYDVTGLITGLGLGGLTFALAAQDIASNFMAGITIILDKPFAIGDWIAVNGMEGIVEEMNFRSTKIRTFDNALISVPNSRLGSSSVTNWTKMNYRKTNIIIGLLYSTTRETLQKVIDDIYSELSQFEEIKTDSLLVKFDNFSASSLDVKISYNSYPIPAPAHMALKEKVQLKIMEVVERHDTDFAYNTVTVVNG
ncbi:MAG: mechanosensitive ion channel family protein [Oscillospiraceae bacterium]|nr:mechanosensitive ion channel family protein [Oscillospiraceae bacterium]